MTNQLHRRFHIHRGHELPPAEGVLFTDGTCVVRKPHEWQGFTVHLNLAAVEEYEDFRIDGAVQLTWIDAAEETDPR